MYLYISGYIHIYIYIYVYIYIYWKKNTTFCDLLHSFAKEQNVLTSFLRSLQKNKTFSVFFYVLCKRMLHSLCSFMFLRKEHKRTHCSFEFHKTPNKTKKERKRTLHCLKELKSTMSSEWKRTQWPTLVNIVGECCGWMLWVNVVSECCGWMLWVNVVGKCCEQMLWANIVSEYCCQMLWANVVGECCVCGCSGGAGWGVGCYSMFDVPSLTLPP